MNVVVYYLKMGGKIKCPSANIRLSQRMITYALNSPQSGREQYIERGRVGYIDKQTEKRGESIVIKISSIAVQSC